jgi:hypothetical protein
MTGEEFRPCVEIQLGIQGAEEGIATDVIPMGVGDEDRRCLSRGPRSMAAALARRTTANAKF